MIAQALAILVCFVALLCIALMRVQVVYYRRTEAIYRAYVFPESELAPLVDEFSVYADGPTFEQMYWQWGRWSFKSFYPRYEEHIRKLRGGPDAVAATFCPPFKKEGRP